MRTGKAVVRSGILAGGIVGVLAAASVAMAGPADFYKGKTVRIDVGTGPGGGYDTYARLIAPLLAKKLDSTVIVENRPGGSMMVAMNYVYNAEPDGLTMMLAPGEGAVLGKLTDSPGVRFDLLKYPVIARVNTAPRVLLVNPKSPYKSFDDVRHSKDTVSFGGAGRIDGSTDTAAIMCHALKMNCKMVIGYPSSKAFTLAAIRGEVDATTLAEDSAFRFSKGGQLRPLAVVSRESSDLFPKLPTVFEATKVSPEAAEWLDFRDDVRKLGRLLVTSKGVAPERLAFLRRTMHDILTDPEAIKSFAAKSRPIKYASGEEMEALIKKVLGSLSPQRAKEVKYVINKEFYD